MERRLRNIEEVIRIGAGNNTYPLGPHHLSTPIRPGRPDMSHVNGAPAPNG